jgi:hypothetical protein
MLSETKIWDVYGNLKKIISTQELHTRHWKIFNLSEESLAYYPKKNSSKPKIKTGQKDKATLVDRY